MWCWQDTAARTPEKSYLRKPRIRRRGDCYGENNSNYYYYYFSSFPAANLPIVQRPAKRPIGAPGRDAVVVFITVLVAYSAGALFLRDGKWQKKSAQPDGKP